MMLSEIMIALHSLILKKKKQKKKLLTFINIPKIYVHISSYLTTSVIYQGLVVLLSREKGLKLFSPR